MFNKWLNENNIHDFDFSGTLFPNASARSFWETKYQAAAVAYAQQFLNFDWPLMKATDFMAFNLTGNRLQQETPHFARRKAMVSLVIAEVLEHKGRFIPDIVDGIFAICEETFWGISTHYPPARFGNNIPSASDHYVDLFAAETAELLSVTYYLLYEDLYSFCPEILQRLEYEVDRRILVPYLNHTDYHWMGYHETASNWTTWILSNVLTVLLLMEKSRVTFDLTLKKMMKELQHYYDCMPEDGGCDEGISYWVLAGGKLFEFCDQLYRVTGGKINLFEDPKFRNIQTYPCRAYIGKDFFVNFADGRSRMSDNMDYVLYANGLRLGEPSLCALAKSLATYQARQPGFYGAKMKYALYSLIYQDEIAAQPEYTPDNTHILPQLQASFLRQGKWFVGAKGGHNGERHNHNDVGSFIAYYENSPVLIDPGTGTYTKQSFTSERYNIWNMQSAWHNLPLINGIQQKNGREFACEHFACDGSATDIRFAAAYPEEAGVEALTRRVRIRNDGICLTDRFSFRTSQNAVEEHFSTTLPVRIDGSRVILDDRFVLSAQNATGIRLDHVSFEGDPVYIRCWKTEGVNRICFLFDTGKDADITVYLHELK